MWLVTWGRLWWQSQSLNADSQLIFKNRTISGALESLQQSQVLSYKFRIKLKLNLLKQEEMTSTWSQRRSWISVSSIKMIILAVRHIKLRHVFILFLHNRLQSADSVCTVFMCVWGSRFTGRPCCSCRRTGRQGGSRRRWRVGLLPQTAPTHWDSKRGDRRGN